MENEEQAPKKNNTGRDIFIAFLITALIFGGLFLIGYCINNCSNSTNTPGIREATNSDIYIEMSQEFSLDMQYIVIPNCNINGLEITFYYYDGNNKLLTKKVKDLKNVKKGIQYPVNITLIGEFSLNEIVTMHSCSAKVTGGMVSLL